MKHQQNFQWYKVAFVMFVFGFSQFTFASSHRYINSIRGSQTNFYFEHEIEGYSGQAYSADLQSFRLDGRSINSTIGAEYFGLFQLEAGHQFTDLTTSDPKMSGIEGSTYNAGISLFFVSPIANIEIGAGTLLSDYEAENELGNGKYYGTGLYRTLGLQYFLTSGASLQLNLNQKEQKLTLANGNEDFSSTKNLLYNGVSVGFKLWL